MSAVFRFKQFGVDQSGCAMKINTDGVLLAAIAGHPNPQTVLDIGTGTGVIALMLAQRFPSASIDGVEIDPVAAETAGGNFANSAFSARMRIFPGSFQAYFDRNAQLKYDLIVSNPPFFINSLKSPDVKTNTAKHTGNMFFEELVMQSAQHLSADGRVWLVLPPLIAELVKNIATQYHLYPERWIQVRSFSGHPVHRVIFSLSFHEQAPANSEVLIYESPKNYSSQFSLLLKDFFIIF